MRFQRYTTYALLALACCATTGCPNLIGNARRTAAVLPETEPPLTAARLDGNLPAMEASRSLHARNRLRRLPPAPASQNPIQFASLEESVPGSQIEPPDDAALAIPGRPAYSKSRVALRPRTVEEALNPEAVVEPQPFEPMIQELDLTSALSIAGGQSPQIAYAGARYREAYARLTAAQTLWLPSLRVGVSYNHHDGRLQASSGEVLDASRSAFQGGLGAGAVGAGSPMIPGLVAQFHTTDAIFQPKIASHGLCARQAATEAATNDALLATALAYLELLRASQELRIAEETRDNAQQLADLTDTFSRTGQGPQADADRAKTELVFRRNDVSRGEEAVAVASARLAEQLSLDGTVRILPLENTVVPIDLVTPDLPLADLVASGLSGRPELAEAQHLVCEAVQRYQRERCAPLVPSVLLGLSQSGFGGGLGSEVDRFSGRLDFDAAVYWELRNFGFGERAKRDEMQARREQAQALQVRMMDRVAREVVEAGTQVQMRKSQIKLAESAIVAATESYDRNLSRIREGHGLPIEVLQAMQALDAARREYLRTVVDYNEAQFRLQRALGWPIQ